MSDQLVTGNSFSRALSFGQDALPERVAHAADYPLGVLIMLIACKALAYGLSLSAFRGGPCSRRCSPAQPSASRQAGCRGWTWACHRDRHRCDVRRTSRGHRLVDDEALNLRIVRERGKGRDELALVNELGA
jgi:hypothetical protein